MTVFTDLVEENKIEMPTQHVAASDSQPASPADEGVQPPEDSDESFFRNRDQDPEIQD